MSANNIVVIIKGRSGKFRAYHRDYDAYIEGRYENIPIKERDSGVLTPIFEADSCEEAILKYDKWLNSMNDGEGGVPFTVGYGYVFEGLVPNKLTAETLEKSERGEGLSSECSCLDCNLPEIEDISLSVEIVFSKDKYDKLSSIAQSNGWTIQGLLGPALREVANDMLARELVEEIKNEKKLTPERRAVIKKETAKGVSDCLDDSIEEDIVNYLSPNVSKKEGERPSAVVDFLDEFITDLRRQLNEDAVRWGYTWLNRTKDGQEKRTRARYDDYFDKFEHGSVPVPWLKIVGGALICWIREQHPELFPDDVNKVALSLVKDLDDESDKMVREVIDGVKVIYPRDAIEGFKEEHGIDFRAEIRNYIAGMKREMDEEVSGFQHSGPGF